MVAGNSLRNLFGKIAKAYSLLWRAMGGASLVVGFVAGCLFLFPPRLTVELFGGASGSYPVTFQIKNAWVLPMRHVIPFMGLCRMSERLPFGGSLTISGNCKNPTNVRLGSKDWKPRYLRADDSFTAPISDVFDFPPHTYLGGDIVFGATFKTWFWPFTMDRAFRFVSVQQPNGNYHWVPEAMPE
ncbi:MAG TPA: hypothetical protein VMF53_08900 [Alphaproteobacteria bacterium]|nr:hypothetical protein [Alphaproteobacteria bacterium]